MPEEPCFIVIRAGFYANGSLGEWGVDTPKSPQGHGAFDAGLTLPWMAEAVDLAGNPRLNGTVDMGCYECWMPNTGTMLLIR